MQIYHNSQDEKYRNPFGAVTLGSEVSLRIFVSEFVGKAEAKIRLWTDSEGEKWIEMTPFETPDGLLFSGSFHVPETPLLLWYSFLISDDISSLFYGNNEEMLGGVGRTYSDVPPSYQITVFKDYEIPSWYKNSIAYQIFPDRFRRGSDFVKRSGDCLLETKENGPKTLLREDWSDTPTYTKNEKGDVTHWDFFGGTLQGITEKLDYLQSLGIGTLYLNPIFKALSNHRYDTGDYMRIDPRLGDEKSFKTLCKEAEKRGISIILDGVFNHTGNDSIYFDAYRNHNTSGAYENPDSPYASWYEFKNSEQTEYESWWGVKDLPALNKNDKGYQNFIFGSKDSVIRHWMNLGAKGWRLDVADELNDEFIAGIKKAVKETDADGLLLGEVWEDASNKISYGKMRKYLLGDELDCVMNYPMRTALIHFLTGKISSDFAGKKLMSLYENYPRPAMEANFNLISSHDRARILTMLNGFDEQDPQNTKTDSAVSEEALKKLWLILIMQMTLPGVPCIYYGDEAGLTGGLDPDNRKTYPWGKENKDILNTYRSAISLRKEWPVFTEGSFSVIDTKSSEVFGYKRANEKEEILVFLNRSPYQGESFGIRSDCDLYDLLSANLYKAENGVCTVALPPCTAVVLRKNEKLCTADHKRSCGVLCHITSIPSKWGQGDLGDGTKAFIEKLKKAGQSWWQILPLNPVDEYDSPYATSSAFAGNIQLISPEELLKIGLLTESDLKKAEEKAKFYLQKNDRNALKELKLSLLKKAFSRFEKNDGFLKFCQDQAHWLFDFCRFEALKSHYGEKEWQLWSKEHQDPKVHLPDDLKAEADFHCFCQYIFFLQWDEIHSFARKCGIQIIGDLPFYVGLCGADVWSNQNLFLLNEKGFGTELSGVPPDYFSEEGQIWNNPLYNWREMEKDGFSWWLNRLKQAFSRYDLVRLDHFRGFEQFWSIPAGEKSTAGCWKFGPGLKLFEKAKEKFGALPVLTEDLGDITVQVKNLLFRCGFPGTDVFQFSYPERLKENIFVAKESAFLYSGTHDNQTLLGFLSENSVLMKESKLSAKDVIKLLLESTAPVVVFPLQDLLGLNDLARMNVPGKTENNWKWQFENEDFSDEKATEILKLIKNAKRI